MKIFFLFFIATSAFAFSPVQEETIYRNYYREFFDNPGFTQMPKSAEEQKLALDAIEDATVHGAPTLKLANWFSEEQISQLNAPERLRLLRLKASHGVAMPSEELSTLRAFGGATDKRSRFELAKLRTLVKSAVAKQILDTLSLPSPTRTKKFLAPSVAEVKALYSELPDIAGFMQGHYAGAPRIFVFCRHDHNYPCLLSMRDKNNEAVKENGKTWLQPALGLSDRGLPYNERNGNTPQGAQLIDGVMPVADMPIYYGKFRRMVLTFADPSPGEKEQKKLFPPAVQASAWWQEAVEARDLGRNLLRIHGVGELNPDSSKTYYPFIPTIGCLAQLEGKYGSTDYIDQRKLLDHFMKAAGLEAKFENEPNIRGVMYTIEIDDKSGPVKTEDLKPFGIF
ncbi:MAG: hypothetical protein ACXWQO_15860 [Bdellovibrionota bacterium]